MSWGGLTTDPVTKAAVTLALNAFRPEHVPAGFLQGDTIGNRADFEANAGVVSTDVLFMKAVDYRYRLGGAPIAVPVTEVERIPTWQEVAQVHAINRRLEQYLPSVAAASTGSRSRRGATSSSSAAGGSSTLRSPACASPASTSPTPPPCSW